MLSGKKGIVFGIRSPKSIGWTIAQVAAANGAELCLSYRGEREERRARQLSEELGGALCLPCDVTDDDNIQALYDQLGQQWDSLDFIVHSIAFGLAEDMEAGVIGTSRNGFAMMNDISSYSLAAVTRPAVPMMKNGGSVVAMTYVASERVVPNYGPMGVAKAALECIVRYLASELGPVGIRCNALSAGPISTPAARGIPRFTSLLRGAENASPMHRNVTLEEVANTAVFLLSDMATAITGETLHVDCGMHIA